MNKNYHNFNNLNFSYYLRDDVDFSVFNEIFKFVEYKSSIDLIKKSTMPIIDIGAHVGFFSIFVSCLNKNIFVYAVEPEKKNFELLEKHKNENNLKNIKTFKCAIGEETKNGNLFISEDSVNNFIVKNNLKNKINDKNFQNVRIFSIKDFLDTNNIKKVSLIKMDIEGEEFAIINSIDKDTYLRIGAFIMEYHEINNKNENFRNKKDIENKLRENGFSVQIFPSNFDKNMGFIFALNKRSDII